MNTHETVNLEKSVYVTTNESVWRSVGRPTDVAVMDAGIILWRVPHSFIKYNVYSSVWHTPHIREHIHSNEWKL
jgi:hypothetical protein